MIKVAYKTIKVSAIRHIHGVRILYEKQFFLLLDN